MSHDPQALLDKAVALMSKHLDQLRIDSERMTKDGLRGLTANDSQVIERYSKVLMTMTKRAPGDDLENLTDEQLQEILNESQDNVHSESSED